MKINNALLMQLQQRVIQTLLFLFTALPCCVPFRYQPNTVFPSELTALMLALLVALAGMALPSRRLDTQGPLHKSGLLWLVFFAITSIVAILGLPWVVWQLFPEIHTPLSQTWAWFDKPIASGTAIKGKMLLIPTMILLLLVALALFMSWFAELKRSVVQPELDAPWQNASESQEPLALPLACLPWLGLAAVICLQLVALPTTYYSERLYPLIYGLVAALAVFGLSRAQRAFGFTPLVEALAWGVLCGAIFNSVVSLEQVYSVMKNGSGLVYGHIGQRNLYGHYLAWALAATVWLMTERKMSIWLFGSLAAWLTLAMAWSASRSVLFYALAWLIAGAWLLILQKHVPKPASPGMQEPTATTSKPTLVLMLMGTLVVAVALVIAVKMQQINLVGPLALLWAGFCCWRALQAEDATARFGWLLGVAAALILGFQFITPYINDFLQAQIGVHNTAPTGLDRLDSNGLRRIVEWKKALITFAAHPILGAGWGAFPPNSVALHVRPEFARVWESVLFTHAHNSPLNLMAETGIIGALIVVGSIVALFLSLLKHWRNPVVLFGASMATVSMIHSQLEYPLWYFHLLGPFALALYLMCSQNVPRLRLPAIEARSTLAMLAVAGLVFGIYGGKLYGTIHPLMEPGDLDIQNQKNITTLKQLTHNPLLDYPAEYALTNYYELDVTDPKMHLELLRRVDSVSPYPGPLMLQAILEARNGNGLAARTLVQQAAYSFPESFDYFYDVLQRHPEPSDQVLTPLIAEVDKAACFFISTKQEIHGQPQGHPICLKH